MSPQLKAFAAAAVVLLATAVSGAQAPQQSAGPQPPPQVRIGTAAVIGTTIDGQSGQPLSGVVVTLTGRGMPAQRVVVDSRGRFVFPDLPAGIFNLQAVKPGYVGGGAGQGLPTGLPRPLEIAESARVADLQLKLWKLGAIDGAVFGDANEPLVGVDVHALRRSLVGGRWRLTDNASATTDDRGHYRVSGLPPGDYAVVARPPRTREIALLLATLSANPLVAPDIMTGATMSGRGDPELDARMRDYPMTAYPAAASSGRATLITVEADGQRTGIDFHLNAARVVRVTGVAQGDGMPTSGLTIRLIPADSDTESTPLEAATASCDDEGHFAFAGVTPGRYVAVALLAPAPPPAPNPPPPGPQPAPALPNEPTLWAKVPVTVGVTDVMGLTIPVHKGLVLGGRVEFDGATQPSAVEVSQVILRMDSIDQLPPQGNAPVWRGRIDADGRFRTMGVPPGEYLLRVATPPRGWTIQSARAGGHDALDEPITIADHDVSDVVISFATRPLASLSGSIRHADGAAAADSAILIFPSDPAAWRDTSPLARRFRQIRPIQSGAYSVQGLPPGDYCVAAIAVDPSPGWQEPSQLEILARRATRVRLEAGPTQTLDLQVIK